MAFTRANEFGKTSGDVVNNQKLDQSQLGKLEDMGQKVTPVSSDPSVLTNTTPVIRDVGGTKVPGFQDTKGDFYVLTNDNVVASVTPAPTKPNDFNTGGVKPLEPSTPVLPGPVVTVPSPTGTVPTLPPTNLGSGRIYTRFDSGDIVPNQEEIVTRAMWSNNVGNLLTFYTSSAQTAGSKEYYYGIYNSSSGDCGSQPQFAIAWGHKLGSGSADQGGQINDTPSRAIYGQYKQLCLEPEQDRFTIGGTATDSIYVINVNRARMREFVDEGNLEINLQHLSGSQWLTGGGAQNAWTGSNVRVFPTQRVIRLVDDSKIANATITSAGEIYNIVSGSLEDGIYNSSAPHYYGLLYKRQGIIVLDGNVLDRSGSFLTVTGSEVPGDNAYKLFLSISGSAKYTDTSGDYMGFQARSGEKVKSSHFFVRVKNQEYNFSNNPTFVTGSEGDLAEPLMIGDPQVFISEIGLYNDNKELLGVAKTNKAIKKNFSSEALLKVKIIY